MWLPEIEGVLSTQQAFQTAQKIAELQLENGMIPWFEDGHADPWNHIECAMALDLAGMEEEAQRAYEWLAHTQHPNGAWHQYYLKDGVEQDRLDANCAAYIATGVWHHYLCTQNQSFLESFWQPVQKAMDFVLGLQTQRGEIIWARHADGKPWSFALLTGSCSIYHSIKVAVQIAEYLDDPRPEWEMAGERLGKVIASQPEAFTPKKRWAMDWYYPVLSGVVTEQEAAAHLSAKEEIFIDWDMGVRCVSNRDWFTAAETAECTMAYLLAGDRQKAEQLFATTAQLRSGDGSYFTGIVHPELVNYPAEEKSSYTAAAVLLAADALTNTSPAQFFSNTLNEPVAEISLKSPDSRALR